MRFLLCPGPGATFGYLNPFERGRGNELKRQLARGAIRAIEAVRSVIPGAIIVAPDPVIHVAGDTQIPGDVEGARGWSMGMFEAWDMLTGRLHPELGGGFGYVDVIGINYYDRNQRRSNGAFVQRTDFDYRPLSLILRDVYDRYRLPIVVSETGTEGEDRPGWFAYILTELNAAKRLGVPVHGVCLYPILNHPGWMMTAIVTTAFGITLTTMGSVSYTFHLPTKFAGMIRNYTSGRYTYYE